MDLSQYPFWMPGQREPTVLVRESRPGLNLDWQCGVKRCPEPPAAPLAIAFPTGSVMEEGGRAASRSLLLLLLQFWACNCKAEAASLSCKRKVRIPFPQTFLIAGCGASSLLSVVIICFFCKARHSCEGRWDRKAGHKGWQSRKRVACSPLCWLFTPPGYSSAQSRRPHS